jgi:hypothetical protein
MKVFPTARPARRRVSVLAVGATLTALMASTGWAQELPMPGASPGAGNIATGRNVQSRPEKPPEPAPDAIPGAKARQPAAPATRATADMQPTDALFDAINRGDVAAARDALSRGADLEARNMLGMSPMELSVDLGRNDISFLLLSYRGGDSSAGAPAATAQAQAATPPKPAKEAGAKAARNATVLPVKAIAPAAPQTPRLFANDGGTPVPNAGFLGFDTTR